MYPITNIASVTSSTGAHSLYKQPGSIPSNAVLTEDKGLLISKLSLLLPEERNLLITQVTSILTDTMTVEDQVYIINRLSFLLKEEREVLIRQVLRLVSDSLSDQDRIFIITRLSFMSLCEREIIVKQVLDLMKDDMSAGERKAIMEERIRLLHRKYRFRLNSNEIGENPLKIFVDIFETLARNSIELSSYSIEYIDANTIDDGGLLRAFLAKLTESFCNPKYSLITETSLGAIPTINSRSSSCIPIKDQEKCFKTLGTFFSMALQDDNALVLGQNFHPIVFDMIFSLTVEDLTKIDSQQVFDKMLLIWLLREGNMEENLAENIIQDKITQKIRDIYGLVSKKEFIKMYGLEEKVRAVLIVARAIYDSLPHKVEWDFLKGTSATLLREKIQGTISQQDVLKALFLDNVDKPEENSVLYLKKWIMEANPEEIKKLVEASSGVKTLSTATKLTVVDVRGTNKLPIFYVCFSQIGLFSYTSYEVFKAKLEMSLDYCLKGSGFQRI